MKWCLKWTFRLGLALVLLVVAFVLLLDPVAKAILEYRLQRQTGAEVTIGRLQIGLLSPKFHLENLILYNPPEFGGSPMLNLPEFHVEYDLRALLSGRLHLTAIRFHMDELHIVEGRDGRYNLLAVDQRLKALSAQNTPASASSSNSLVFAGIDNLELSLGRLRYSSLKTPETKGYYLLNIRQWAIIGIKKPEEIPAALETMAKRKGLESLWNRLFEPTNSAPRRPVGPPR
jgi:uncharacterized protein involved in outer membrane biogenesis